MLHCMKTVTTQMHDKAMAKPNQASLHRCISQACQPSCSIRGHLTTHTMAATAWCRWNHLLNADQASEVECCHRSFLTPACMAKALPGVCNQDDILLEVCSLPSCLQAIYLGLTVSNYSCNEIYCTCASVQMMEILTTQFCIFKAVQLKPYQVFASVGPIRKQGICAL